MKLMTYKYSIFTFCGIITVALLCWLLTSISRKPQTIDVSRLAIENIHILNLPDSSINDDYSDLEFLVQELAGKNIVVLGEALHYDGSTFRIKTRIIKFLHEKLGFNILLFEGGIYDMHLLNERLINNPNEFEPSSSLWTFWSESEQMMELWDYICTCRCMKGLTPLYVGGIDCQHSGNITDSLRHSFITETCNSLSIDFDSDFPRFSHFMPHMTKTMLNKSFFRHKIQYDSLAVLNNELLTLAERLGRNDVYLQRYIDGIRNCMLYSWEFDAGYFPRTIWRDSLMADNFIFHRNMYPKEKIVVWTSNMHASKSGALNYQNPEHPIQNFGNRLHSHYSDSLYVIMFNNWSRESNDGHIVSFLKQSSVEYAIHKVLYPHVNGRFLFFSHPEEFGKTMCSGIMEGEFVCRPGDMCDALIYEDNVEFVRYNDEE